MPLVGVVRWTLIEEAGADGRKIRRQVSWGGVVAGRECLELCHGQEPRRGRCRRGSAAEECIRDAVGEVLGHPLRELGSFDRSHLGSRVGRAQNEDAPEAEQFVLDQGAAEGTTELVASEHRDRVAPCRPRGTSLKDGAAG